MTSKWRNKAIKKLADFPIHQFLHKLGLNDSLWEFDAVSSYQSAMSDEKSIYGRIETRYAFAEDMNDEVVEKLNNQSFNQSAILKLKY